MKLFKMENYEVQVTEEAWALEPFKAILKRDKTKNKEKAFKEMAFIFHYADLRSDYMNITNPIDRSAEVKKDVGLPEGWKIDPIIDEAIDFYLERSTTILEKLYKDAVIAVDGVRKYLRESETLLKERDANDRPIFKPKDITASLKDVKDIMQQLKAAEKEVIKEKQETEGRTKGARTYGEFEDGL
jgi:hypothetical protein